MRRLVAFVVVVAASSMMGAASAQKAVNARIDYPNDGSLVEGTVTVHATASGTVDIKRFELFIGDTSVKRLEPEAVERELELEYSWNTEVSVSSGYVASNGQYTLKVEVVTTSGATDQHYVRVNVDNPPSTPVLESAFASGRNVSVSWRPNPEPDITSYIVERDDGEGFRVVGRTSELSFSEKLPPGSHSYRVTAVRPSPSSGERSSAPSEPMTATVARPERAHDDPPLLRPGHGGPSSRRAGAERSHAAARPARSGGLDGFGRAGLPSGVALPGRIGLPGVPRSEALEWGTYEERLPYERSTRRPLNVGPQAVPISAPLTVVPPDGLRWVAAGLLLLVVAGGLRIVATTLIDGRS